MRGYTDYSPFGKWTAQGVSVVTRMKSYALYEVVKEQEIPKNGHLLKDEIIHLAGTQADEKSPHRLRRIEVYNPEKDEVLVFLTNNMKLSATTIAVIYKACPEFVEGDRWHIELFFKALKQNLKIKTFVGTSVNAVKIQIWTALIAMVILKYLQLSSKFAWSLSNLVALLRMNLFTHRAIWAWLDKPFETPPAPYEPKQLSFNFS